MKSDTKECHCTFSDSQGFKENSKLGYIIPNSQRVETSQLSINLLTDKQTWSLCIMERYSVLTRNVQWHKWILKPYTKRRKQSRKTTCVQSCLHKTSSIDGSTAAGQWSWLSGAEKGLVLRGDGDWMVWGGSLQVVRCSKNDYDNCIT